MSQTIIARSHHQQTKLSSTSVLLFSTSAIAQATIATTATATTATTTATVATAILNSI